MKILLVAATKQEVNIDFFSSQEILITGVGMMNTTFSLTEELLQNNYDLVVNMGVAGSFNSDIEVGDIVEIVEDVFSEIGFEDGDSFLEFSDFEMDNTFKVIGKTDLKKVKGITVNTVHGNVKSISEVVDRLNPDVETMEGAACFMVCNKFEISCIQIRSISNKVEKRNKENWDLSLAIKNLNTAVKKIILDI
ncbi:MAG: futalosine hydrolase [Flavobacteriales bacterium]|tara:strand:- start:68 stop:646 length:579 start_codon:yes stop_codon:yes gene_type:complete